MAHILRLHSALGLEIISNALKLKYCKDTINKHVRRFLFETYSLFFIKDYRPDYNTNFWQLATFGCIIVIIMDMMSVELCSTVCLALVTRKIFNGFLSFCISNYISKEVVSNCLTTRPCNRNSSFILLFVTTTSHLPFLVKTRLKSYICHLSLFSLHWTTRGWKQRALIQVCQYSFSEIRNIWIKIHYLPYLHIDIFPTQIE